jgi:hypothetical protein
MSLRNLLTGFAFALTTVAVAPATAQAGSIFFIEDPTTETQVSVVGSNGLDMPLTKVCELLRSAPKQIVEQNVSVWPIPEPTRVTKQPIVVEPSQPKLEPTRVVQPQKPEFTQTVKSAPVQPKPEPSLVVKQETASVELQEVEKTQPKPEPTQVIAVEKPQPLLEPSREQNVVQATPDTSLVRVEPSQLPLEPSRVRQPVTTHNNIVPFKPRVVHQTKPSWVKPAANNIVPFKKRLGIQDKPSWPVLETKTTSFSREVFSKTAFTPETAVSTQIKPSEVVTPETTFGFSSEFGLSSSSEFKAKTAFSLDRDIATTPVPKVRTSQAVRNTSNVRPISTQATDLSGTRTIQSELVQPQQVAEVETQQVESEPEVKPKASVSVGISGIGDAPLLETAVGLEYDSFSSKVSLNHPLNGQGQDALGLETTFPLSEQANLTVKADQINVDPTISATVGSTISEQLKVSASFNNINKPDFNLELATNYQIDDHWSVAASGNVMTRQLNIGATYANRGLEASVKVDDVAAIPQLGLGLGLELSPSTKLEVSANNINGDPNFGVKVTQSFSF